MRDPRIKGLLELQALAFGFTPPSKMLKTKAPKGPNGKVRMRR